MDIARMQTPGWPCGGDQLTVHALWHGRPTTANYFARLRTITCAYASTLVNGVRSRKPRCTEGQESKACAIADRSSLAAFHDGFSDAVEVRNTPLLMAS